MASAAGTRIGFPRYRPGFDGLIRTQHCGSERTAGVS
jgi:hypothetical protein